MANIPGSDFDKETAFANHARLRPGGVLQAERERQLKGYPPDIALEKWGYALEEIICEILKI